MQIKPCRPYHSKTIGFQLLEMPAGKSVFKLYFVSIVGRDRPELYEWGAPGPDMAAAAERFRGAGLEGVGFIIAFPHITKVFRFAPAMETVLHVRAFNTGSLEPLGLGRDDDYLEFACYAEAAIAAEEYHAWAAARTVGEYLRFQSRFTDGPVNSNRKLADYYTS